MKAIETVLTIKSLTKGPDIKAAGMRYITSEDIEINLSFIINLF
jgi:hypothetical protein